MDTEEIRRGVEAAIASIAPECDVRQIRPDCPLREQVDLDSLDWLNVLAALHDRLEVDIPESNDGRPATLDSIVSLIASRRARPGPAVSPRAGADPGAAVHHRLTDGTIVTLRPLCAEDAVLEADFVRHLSAESRYKRFMRSVRELRQGELKSLTQVDGDRCVALVATVEREGREVPLGVARYDIDATGKGCEFAIAVDDPWHDTGVSGVLMNALMDAARARGLTRMEGIVLATNSKMLKFVRQLGFSLQHEAGDWQTVRVARSL